VPVTIGYELRGNSYSIATKTFGSFDHTLIYIRLLTLKHTRNGNDGQNPESDIIHTRTPNPTIFCCILVVLTGYLVVAVLVPPAYIKS
jgi:hypothetical protein